MKLQNKMNLNDTVKYLDSNFLLVQLVLVYLLCMKLSSEMRKVVQRGWW